MREGEGGERDEMGSGERWVGVESSCCSFIQSFTFSFCLTSSFTVYFLSFPLCSFCLQFFKSKQESGKNKTKKSKLYRKENWTS